MRRLLPTAPWVALAVLTAIILGHAGLLPLGRWHYDEFCQSVLARVYGTGYLLGRLSGESPRPASESVLFVYYQLVTWAQRPLMQPFLLVHWGLLLAACLVSARPQPRKTLVWRVLLAGALLCLFLLGHDITELFFWPAAVAPYLETLAALTLVLFLMLDGRADTVRGRLACQAALSLAAAASEAGAMFALPFAALRLLAALRARRRSIADWVGWTAPLGIAALLLGLVATSHRLATAEPVAGPSPTVHHPLASLLAAVPQLGRELIVEQTGYLRGPMACLLLFAAARWCWRLAAPDAERPRGLLAFAVAAALGGLGVLVAAEYQYGTACCTRHAALRHCLFLLSIVGLAALAAPARVANWQRLAAPACLLMAVALPLQRRLPDLVADYRLRAPAIAARSDTWQSGLAEGQAMTFHPPPAGRVLNGGDLPPGHYVQSPDTAWWTTGVLLFFHKREVEVLPITQPSP